MAVTVADVVGFRVPVVGELDHGTLVFVLVTHEGQREAPLRIVFAAQEMHAHDVGVEHQGTIQVADAQHGV